MIDFRNYSPLYGFDKPDPFFVLRHTGTPHEGDIPHSGRWPYGSGEKPYQHSLWFVGFGDKGQEYYKKYGGKFNDCIRDLENSGMSRKQIAEQLGIPVDRLNGRVALTKAQFMTYQFAEAVRLKNEDPSRTNEEIAKSIGCTEGTIRNYLKQGEEYLKRANSVMELVDDLKKRVDENGVIDISEGNEYWINATATKLATAASILEDQGYVRDTIHVKRVFGDNWVNISVLAKPGETKESIINAARNAKIKPVFEPEINENATSLGLDYEPVSVDSKRIGVVYAEDGGTDRDGLIELRRGVKDLDLGGSNYAQVRIAVDGTHYIKGVAAYSDRMPEGIDILINSNKHQGTPLLVKDDPDAKAVLKPMKLNPDGSINMENPFGATIKKAKEGGQYFYEDEDGTQKLSAINKVYDEGDWEKWARTISSQMLSKQPVTVATPQLQLALAIREKEFNDIMQIQDPTVRKKMLTDYSEACDRAAVDLKAAAFPRQSTNLLMPVPSLKENEVFAPNYTTGEHLILIRHPHALVEEIPYLTVNNNNPEGTRLLTRNAKDAIGVHPKTLAQLSGADCDGDTAIVIPADKINFRYKSAVPELVKFDTKAAYPGYEGMKVMNHRQHGIEMGKISNLITDMQVAGAPIEELVRADMHSMVIVDAEKHKLDFRKSKVDQGIQELVNKYQPADPVTGKRAGGARTIISRASGEIDIPERKEGGWVTLKDGSSVYAKIHPETGEKVYTPTGRIKTWNAYTDKNGTFHPEKKELVTVKSTQMAEAKDASSISTGKPIELAYVEYANGCKRLGNRARLETLKIKDATAINPAAAKAYAAQVESLKGKIVAAKKHSPLERQAMMLAQNTISRALRNNPSIKDSEDDFKKLKTQALAGARSRFGGGRAKLVPTDKEWEAVEAGALGRTAILDIMTYMDSKDLKQRTMPRASRGVGDSTIAMIRRMANMDYTNAEIADRLGISTSTVSNALSA